LLAEGAHFNEEVHRLPTGNTTFIPKGVYHFRSHEEADQQWDECLVKGIAQRALEMFHQERVSKPDKQRQEK
jgi:hypothetical protein